LATFLFALALAVACDAGGEDFTKISGGPAGEDTQENNAVQETVVKYNAAPDKGEDSFVASGEGSGGEVGAADRIESTRFRIFDGYERLLNGAMHARGVPSEPLDAAREDGAPLRENGLAPQRATL
jgi:hypothetical protein